MIKNQKVQTLDAAMQVCLQVTESLLLLAPTQMVEQQGRALAHVFVQATIIEFSSFDWLVSLAHILHFHYFLRAL